MRLGRRSREPGTIAKMALGLLVLGPAFGVLWVAGIRVDRLEPVAPALVYGGLALFAVAEASLAPAGHSLVTKLAPARWASTAMGALLLSRAGGARLALAMGVLMPRGEGLAARPATAVPTWSSFFLLFLGTAVAAGVTLLILEPFLHRWTGRD
jgi:POT family proton-dependent oligopeptide transporter